MRGLYAIVDVDAWQVAGVDLLADGTLEDVARALLAVEPAALQLRHKRGSSRDVLAALRRLRGVVPGSVPLVANDRADLARLAGADVVHVGQDDLAVDDVRRVAPEVRVGLSTHDTAQLAAAVAGPVRPDYLAFGPVFRTTSKERPDPTVGLVGVTGAARVAREAGLPLVAIGGIDLASVPALIEAGVACAAVISALVVAREGRPSLPEIEARARALHQALGR
ncbi:MAG: thiamine phosphate synthase [Myxococcales bacterium]|nr:thiamine phosphate synthase [Myxococcales bacterium]